MVGRAEGFRNQRVKNSIDPNFIDFDLNGLNSI